jgi:hypothetical protein
VFAVDTNTCVSASAAVVCVRAERRSGQGKGNILGSLAEVASCQLEYAYLAKATGKREYFVLVRRPPPPPPPRRADRRRRQTRS